jgi:ankyrin repeat protein
MWAAANDNADAVKALVAFGADTDARSTALSPPEWRWVTTGMVSTLLPRGQWTALMYAARENAIDAARALAESRADLNLQDPDGTTALVLAIVNGHFELARMLLDHGADPNVVDASGMGALYAAVDMHTLPVMTARPAPAVEAVSAADLVRRLLQRGARPNATLIRPILGRHHDPGDPSLGEGTTPLIRAAKASDLEMMRILLEGGADPTLTQRDFTNALIVAAAGTRPSAYATRRPVGEAEELESVKLLVEHGADVNTFNVDGQTALHYAAARGRDQLVGYLARQGARLDTKNRNGLTPLDVALGRGRRAWDRQALPVRAKTAALLEQLARDGAVASVPSGAR